MPESYLILKCRFQIDLPSREKEQFVYEKVSKIARNNLAALIAEATEALEFPAGGRLRIDRLVLDLGELSEIDFETGLLRGIKQQIKSQLALAIQQNKVMFLTREEDLSRVLTQFFMHGYMPSGFGEKDPGNVIVTLLQSFLSESPTEAASAIRTWSVNPVARRRMMEQLPINLRHEISPFLSPEMEDVPAESFKPVHTESSLDWKGAAEEMRNNEITQTEQEIENQYFPDIPDSLIKEGPESEEVESLSTDIPTEEQRLLLHFLEKGSLPQGSTNTVRQIEQMLMDLMAKSPDATRRLLVSLARKTNWTSRVAQQFSIAAQQELLRLFFSQQWPELEEALTHWTQTLQQRYPARVSESFLWSIALRKLLPAHSRHFDAPQFYQYVARQTAAFLSVPILDLPDWVAVLPPNAKPVKNAQRAFGQLTASEQSELQVVLTEQDEPESFPFTTDHPTETAYERLLYRLSHGSTAWWDDVPQTLDELVLQIAGQPDVMRRPAFERLLAADLRDQWLPMLSATTFEHLLSAFWNEYADLLSLIKTAWEEIASSRHLSLLQDSFREIFLTKASSGTPENSRQLIFNALQYIGEHSTQSENFWKRELKAYAETAVSAGDIRYYPIISAFRDPEPDATPAISTVQLSPPQGTDRFRDPEPEATPPIATVPGRNEPNATPDTPIVSSTESQPPYDALLKSEQESIRLPFTKGNLPQDTESQPPYDALLKAEQESIRPHFNPPPDTALQPSYAALLKAELESIRPPFKKPQDTESQPSYAALLKAELESIRLFFTKGILPPDTDWQHPRDMEQAMRRILDKHADLLLPLLRTVFASRVAVDRLLRHFPNYFWFELGRALWPVHIETALQVRSELFSRYGQTDNAQMERNFWQFVFQNADPAVFLKGMAETTPDQALPQQYAFALRFTEAFIRDLEQSSGVPNRILWEQLKPVIPIPESGTPILSTILPELLKRREESLRQTKTAAQKQNLRDFNETPGDAILVHNAGLVILAPFLPRYFDTLDMLENRQFKDNTLAERGVHLLQYLATMQSETPEHLLVLNKILCGLPLETPVPLGIELTESEQNISNSLLEAVIQNWEIMKNASIANLCGSFLLREGLLLEKEDSWTLHVEQKAYDIVLEYLPWTISMIKLPWMEKRIDVTWNKKS